MDVPKEEARPAIDGSNPAGSIRLAAAARLLGVSPVTLRRWADAGKVDYFRTPGGQRRFKPADIERLLDTSSGEGPPPPPAGSGPQSLVESPAAPRDDAGETRRGATSLAEQSRMLSSLLKASRAITSSLVFEDVLEAVARATAEALAAPECMIFSFDPVADTLTAQALYQVEATDYREELGEAFPVADYPLGRELLENGTVLEERISDGDLHPGSRASMEEYGELSSLTVTLRLGDEPLGLLVLTETAFERHYTQAELDLAAALGEQAAVALHNAITYRRQLEQNARLSSLLESSRAAASSLVLDEVLHTVAQTAVDTFGVDTCSIWEYDHVAEALMERCAVEVGSDYQATGMVWPLGAHPSEATILRGQDPVQETISDPDLDSVARASMEEWGEKTCLSVPLRVGGVPLGLLVLVERERERHFTEEERGLAQGLAEQAAIAIHNADLFERLQGRNDELAVRARRMDLISESAYELSSSLELHEVLLSAARRLTVVLDVPNCDIYALTGADELTCLVSTVAGEPQEQWKGRVVTAGEWKSTRLAIESGKALAIRGPSDPRLSPSERRLMHEWGEKSVLVVPVVARDRLIGTVELGETRRERSFTDDEIATAEAVCRMAALAIDNANLYQSQEDRNRQLVSLLDAGRALTSTIRIDEVLRIVAETTAQALGCAECVIFEYEEEADTITARSFYHVGPSDYAELGVAIPLDDSPSDRALIERGEIVVETISDPSLDPEVRASLEEYDEKTCVSVPLRFGDETVGILVLVETREERQFTPQEIELARGLGEQATAAIHNARLFSRLELRTRETGLLNDIAREATASLNVADIASTTVNELKRFTRFDQASLLLADADGRLNAVFSSDEGRCAFDGASLGEFDWRFVERLHDERLVILDLPGDAALLAEQGALEGQRSVAVVGILRDDDVVGALVLASRDEGAFSRADARFLEGLGAHLSLAVNNASLFENVKLMHLDNLKALSSALNAKDYYTLGHTGRVAAYAVLLATELAWSQELVDQVEEIAYLHDVGRIAVPDRTLLKAGPLSDEEWELVREQPVISAEIIEPLLGEHLVAAVRHHHERYDGSGYPDRLAGEGISRIARLLCVVDAYDAMSSRRLYRPVLSRSGCLAEIETCKGTQFDPAMADAFVLVLERLHGLKEEAVQAARQAARVIDALTHARLSGQPDHERADSAEVVAALDRAAASSPHVTAMATEVRADEHRSLIVTVGGEESGRDERVGDMILADQEEMEEYAGRHMDSTVLFVDERGAWVCGFAPIRTPGGEIVALVRAEIPVSGARGPLGRASAAAHTFVGLARDAASRLARVEIDSMTDALSGLYNHRYLQERLSEEVSRALAQDTGLALLFCDLDRFKDVNDRCGHSVGDDVLRRAAQIIARTIRRIDLAARYGGDEFAVVLLESSPQEALDVAERIRATIAETPLAPGTEKTTVSIGIATLPGDAAAKTELLDKADWAMYLAKRRGRNQCVQFKEGLVSPEVEPK